METVIGFILITLVVIFLMWGKVNTIPILLILPFAAALLCGYPATAIAGFMMEGQNSVISIVVLFGFAILYFSALNDVGVFDLFINKLLKRLGNRPWMVLLITGCVAAISHLGGSGATTVAITIPLMLPIYKKMKINPAAIILILSVAAGLVNLVPWSAPAMGLGAVIHSDAQAVWRSLVPVQVVGAALLVGLCFVLDGLERKAGAGMTDAEFDELRKDLDKPVDIKVSRPVFIFDLVLTAVLVLALLLAWLPAAVCFMLALSILLLTNFKGAKEQMNVIVRHSSSALTMMIMMMAIGAFSGILSNTKMLSGMVNAILSVMPASLGTHLVFIVALVAPLIAIGIGNSTMSTALAPLMAGVVIEYGATANNLAAGLMIGQSLAANLSFLVPSTYLALGLAGIDMRQNLKYSFRWIMLINTLLVIVAALFGAFSF